MAILLLDNHDSFTYNLLHLVEKVSDVQVVVRKNNEISIDEALNYDSYILSPGPGLPAAAGIMPELLNRLGGTKPVLGICLGLQAIAEHYGGRLVNLQEVCHGIAAETFVTSDDLLFKNCPKHFITARYHSWIADEHSLPPDLIITARDAEGHVMALAHRQHNVRGVQFHPEAILSEHGDVIIKNWLNSTV